MEREWEREGERERDWGGGGERGEVDIEGEGGK